MTTVLDQKTMTKTKWRLHNDGGHDDINDDKNDDDDDTCGAETPTIVCSVQNVYMKTAE